MIDGLLLLATGILLLFGFVLLRGAPYLPTLKKQTEELFELLDMKKGQTLLELGSGDGRVLAAAAERGIYAVGYELNPLLVIWTKLRYWKSRNYITVHWQDYWLANWPPSDAMYVFLLQPYMSKLDKKLIQYKKPDNYLIVSNSFKITEKKPKKEKNGLFVYSYTNMK